MSKITNPKIFPSCAALKEHLDKERIGKNMMTFATSGGFDPLHVGHLRCFQHMRKLTQDSVLPGVIGKTIIIINDDGFGTFLGRNIKNYLTLKYIQNV